MPIVSCRLRPWFGLVFIFGLSAFQGCQPVMSTSNQAEKKADDAVAEWPFRFKRHNFGAFSYSTYGCKVIYDHFLHLNEQKDELQRSSDSIGPNHLDYMSGSYLGIQNFPPPAVVTWRSKDGMPHEAEIDMAAIFKEELILHRVPKEEVDFETSVGTPEIILEVNDRTINIYTKTRIATKKEQEPGNQHSHYRDDLILVYTHTY